MEIAVTTTGPNLQDDIDPRFGRCSYFLFVDTDTLDFEAINNPNATAGGGAGIQSAQMMVDRGVSTVLTGNCGPNAFQVLNSGGIDVIVGVSGNAEDAVQEFKSGALSQSGQANVESHFGVGGGTGRGMGGGMGRAGGGNMGGGRRQNIQPSASQTPAPQSQPQNSGSELQSLRDSAEKLEDQLEQIQERISQLQQSEPSGAIAVVNEEECDACGACAQVCPENAIQINGIARIDENLCTGCAACVPECPTGAISLQKR
ncbi:MAG: 4Fe-4S binding protein [Planctomycetes bacterium]|nr:4Fe-4S binding protein [Planctomycetota bacterium]